MISKLSCFVLLALEDDAASSADGAGSDNLIWIVGLLAALSVGSLVLTRWRFKKREQQQGCAGGSCPPASAAAPRRSVAASSLPGAQRELRGSMQELLLELEEASRAINSQVDTRLRALNLLIKEADEKIRELKRLQGAGVDDAPTVERMPPPTPETRPDEASDRYALVYAMAERGLSVVEIARDMDMMTGEVELILALRRTSEPKPEGLA